MSTFSNITTIVRTESECSLLREELQLLLVGVFETKENTLEEVLVRSVRASTAQIVRDNLAMKVDPKSYLEDAIADLDKLEVLHLTVAVEPTEDMLIRIIDWVRKNVSDNVILSFDHSSTIVGGAIVSFRGKYRDISLRNVISDALVEDHDKILNQLKPKLNKQK
ncbi:hypothetical protein A2801_03080 [Candidatus Woesebacteria bacterium RIFCSPHIGHO2_01_FULL_41_10]|uniref:ATP synthase subunit delta n=1 Tax=Candidatus Woesebacteria bacterium RIFCSPHIGHO2_01_FULL_41_10 TaxID=1802500 RepID=A0A1F7YLH1_9BACT|nr:MAG: hypothetical protein A2801_03080 [Candidatus Woesebacteria bacterium RIFCSPHIGHO2_01_FULL_41_10]